MLEAMVAMVRSQAPVMLLLPTLPRSLVTALTVPQPSLSGILCSLTGHRCAHCSVQCGYVRICVVIADMIDTPCLQWPG